MGKINTVIFDLDGTLIDSSRDVTAAVNYARQHFGLDQLTVNQVISYIGSGVTRLIEKSLVNDGIKDVDAARKIVIDYYRHHLLEETVVYPGIYSLLESLDGDYNLAIATNKPLDLTQEIIKGLGMEKAFKVIAAPETAGKAKPEPDILRFIIDEFGVNAPEVMMVGDSPIDIQTARNMGCSACAVTWGYNITEVLHASKPDHVIHEPLDLLDYL